MDVIKAGVEPSRALKIIPLSVAIKEARAFLNEAQYLHVVGLVRRLSEFGNEEAMSDMRIEKIAQSIWELKDKGGVLGKINLRVFFGHLTNRELIIVLGAIKKENQHSTPRHIVIRMHNRLRDYARRLAEPHRVVIQNMKKSSEAGS